MKSFKVQEDIISNVPSNWKLLLGQDVSHLKSQKKNYVGNEGLMFNGHRVSFGQIEKPMEIYGGNDCTTM